MVQVYRLIVHGDFNMSFKGYLVYSTCPEHFDGLIKAQHRTLLTMYKPTAIVVKADTLTAED
jgi:hypothetical protein